MTSNAKLEATLRRTPPFDLGIDPFEGQLRDILLRTEEASVRRDDRNDEATKEVVQRGKEAMLLDLCSSHARGGGVGELLGGEAGGRDGGKDAVGGGWVK